MPILRTKTREHAHNLYEAQLLLDGAASCRSADHWQLLRPGQVTLHAPGMQHTWRGHGKPFLRVTLWFNITPAPPMHLPEHWPYQPRTIAALYTLLEDVYTCTPGWANRVVPHVMLLLSRIVALTEWPITAVPECTHEFSLLNLLDRFMEDNLHRSLSRQEIANYLGISERTLTRQFHQYTGTTLFDRLETFRLTRARELLATTSTTIEAISQLVGYSSPSYFCRRFHQQIGMTAGQYREQATCQESHSHSNKEVVSNVTLNDNML